MKILIYNWADYYNNSSRGGGVTVYLTRLINELRREHQVFFVSSGEAYNPFISKPYWAQRKGDDGVGVYEIVNSEIMAPGNLEFESNSVLQGKKTLKVWFDLLDTIKPDVVHFHNIEGLPLDAMYVKSILPNCKVIYTLHNYYGFCANVKLWKSNEENCSNWSDKTQCVMCCAGKIDIEREYKVKLIKWFFKRVNRDVPKLAYKWLLAVDFISCLPAKKNIAYLLSSREKTKNNELYKNIKDRFIYNLNEYCNSILAVSERVSEIARGHGVTNAHLVTSYIGTDIVIQQSVKPTSEKLSILYMGYMSREKGFDFFVDSLSQLTNKELTQINLTVAARNTNKISFEKMCALAKKVNSFKYFDGYTKYSQSNIIAGNHISVVPVLWEDNLPQVAIESVAHGVPFLSSDLGGAKELGGCNPSFIFKNNDSCDFLEKIRIFIKDKSILDTFWYKCKPVVSMEQHFRNMINIYNGLN